jgi:hypothetical protein
MACFSLGVIHKVGLCPSSGDINILMIRRIKSEICLGKKVLFPTAAYLKILHIIKHATYKKKVLHWAENMLYFKILHIKVLLIASSSVPLIYVPFVIAIYQNL